MLIVAGSAQVMFKNKDGIEQEVCELRCGDVIGASDLLKIPVSKQIFNILRVMNTLETSTHRSREYRYSVL